MGKDKKRRRELWTYHEEDRRINGRGPLTNEKDYIIEEQCGKSQNRMDKTSQEL